MNMIIELSVALVAIAFAVLVFFLIKTLKSAKDSLDKVSQTLVEVQKTMDELTYEVKTTVRHAMKSLLMYSIRFRRLTQSSILSRIWVML